MLNEAPKSHRIKLIHGSESRFANFLSEQDQSYFDPLRELLKNDRSLGEVASIDGLGGTELDFSGTDFLICDNDGKTFHCQNKDRFRNAQSSNKNSGQDIPCEIIRYYRAGDRICIDLGRDIAPIPKDHVIFEAERPFIKRTSSDLHQSKMLVVHPSGSSYVYWYLTRVVHFYAWRLIKQIFRSVGNGTELNKYLHLSYGGTKAIHELECLSDVKLPEGTQVYAQKDRDRKFFTVEGVEPDYIQKAQVGKINVYFPIGSLPHVRTKELKK